MDRSLPSACVSGGSYTFSHRVSVVLCTTCSRNYTLIFSHVVFVMLILKNSLDSSLSAFVTCQGKPLRPT